MDVVQPHFTELDITSQDRGEGVGLLREEIHYDEDFDKFSDDRRDTLILEDQLIMVFTVGLAQSTALDVWAVAHECSGLPANTQGSRFTMVRGYRGRPSTVVGIQGLYIP